jgi:hypothetical protein
MDLIAASAAPRSSNAATDPAGPTAFDQPGFI